MAGEWIHQHLDTVNLDVRETHDGTWIDQKCTPDVICFVADCVSEFVRARLDGGEPPDGISFTIKDIWQQPYSQENIGMFGKPAVEMTSREYDKFFSQPIKLLHYAGIIRIRARRRQMFFEIRNMELLEYVSSRDAKALEFLAIYVERVLRASGAYAPFEAFFEEQTEEAYDTVKQSFVDLMRTYTRRGSKGGDDRDAYRIFTKALNAMAYTKKKKGTIRGAISKEVILYSDLLYNRLNFRDVYVSKPKNMTRMNYIPSVAVTASKSSYEIAKAKNRLRRYNQRFNGGISEGIAGLIGAVPSITMSELSELTLPATQMHHIFPQADYPDIAACVENLIALTPNQHTIYAHPGNNTRVIDPTYQYYLLLCKIERIRMNLEMEEKDHIYTFTGLLFVLCEGLKNADFADIAANDFDRVIEMVSACYAA